MTETAPTGAATQSTAPPRVMPTPRTLDLEITARCNLRCSYCYYFDNEAVVYRDMGTDEWLRLLDELGEAAVLGVTLQGGEPFMRRDLQVLIQRIVDNRMRFAILTNGTLIREDDAAFLAATGRCDAVQVSLDGHCAAVHDATRGKGSFDKAVRGLGLLRKHGVPVGSRVTVNRHNVRHLDAVMAFLLEDLGLPNVGTNAACFFGSCRTHAGDVMLSTQDRVLAMEALVRLADRYPGRIMASAGPLAEARRFARMEQARKDGAPPFSNGGHLTGCGCIFSQMAVRSDGVFVPCVMLAHLELGRAGRDRLGDVWVNSPALQSLRSRSRLLLADFDYCRGCPWMPYCTGNCPGHSYTLTGEVDHPSPAACLRAFLADGGRIVEEAQ